MPNHCRILFTVLFACAAGSSCAQDGALDLSFDPGTGANNQVLTMALQSDGKVLIGGAFTTFNGVPCNHIARLNADGSLDATFNMGTGFNGWVSAIAIQSGNKILVNGDFWLYNGVSVDHMVRLDLNGNVDGTFVPDMPSMPTAKKIILQPDGKILLCAQFNNSLHRLNSNGTIDQSIPPATFVTNSTVYDMSLQPDGKILACGDFSMHNGVPRDGITRVNSDFTMDPTFNPGAGVPWVVSVAHGPDGKILIGGSFNNVNGTPRPGVARLNSDGSLDTTFDTDTIGGMQVRVVAPQPDGKVLIGIELPIDMGPPIPTPPGNFYRVNSNGSLDTGFQLGTGPNGFPQALTLQPDGKILLGGSFTSYNGTNRLRIARINGTARVRIKVLLEGPYSSGQMNDALRALPTFPLTEPFTAMSYSEAGYTPGAAIHPSTLSVAGNNAIVDWVIVEMRPAATPNVVAASRAVLLQRDGDVVDLDGVSSVGFSGLAHGNYSVVVKPRNHLPVMLSPTTPFAYGTSTTAVDFTLPGTQVYDNDARKNVSGVMLLRAGDVTFNEALLYVAAGNDRDPILVRIGSSTPTATVSGYYPEDVNMDGVVKYVGTANDRDPILVNVGGTNPTATTQAQLP